MTELVHILPNERPIDEILVVMSVDDGGHGICGAVLPGLGSAPLFSASLKPEVLAMFKANARELAKLTGKTIAVFKFKRADTVWLCDPAGWETESN